METSAACFIWKIKHLVNEIVSRKGPFLVHSGKGTNQENETPNTEKKASRCLH
jgi:hypothetical protein